MMDRLSFADEGTYDLFQMCRLIFSDINSFSGFGKDVFILLLCWNCIIESFFKGASSQFFTTVAYIGRFVKKWAYLWLIKYTVRNTVPAEAAISFATSITYLAEKTDVTIEAV